MWLIILLYALFASSFSITKVLLNYSSPLFLAGMRMSIAGLILLSYQYFYAHKHFHFKWKHMKYYVQLVIFGIYLTYILRFWALDYMPSAKVCFLYNFSPFLSAFYSYIFFKEKMTKKQWTGLFIGFLGFLPILYTSSPGEQLTGEWGIFSWPELAVLVSVASHSYSWIVMRRLIRDKSYSPVMVNGISMSSGGILALITSFFVEGFFPVSQVGPFFGWLLFIIFLSNIICHNLYGYLLKSYTTTFLSFAGFLSPIFAAFYGYMFLNEKIGWPFYLSTGIVFIGLFLFYQDELTPKTEFISPTSSIE